MITYYTIKNEEISLATKETKDIAWLHLETPTQAEIKEICQQYQLPSDYITAVLDDVENARTEGLSQTSFQHPILIVVEFPFVSTSPSGQIQYLTFPLSLIITPDHHLISVANHRPPFFQQVLTTPIPQNDMSPKMNLMLSILWELVLGFNQHLEEINRQVNHLEKQIQISTENKRLYEIMDIQKSLVFFEASTTKNYQALEKLFNAAAFSDHHALHNHLHDILVETKQAVSTSRIYMKLVNQMTEMFSAIVSNNLNNIMKILTSLTIVLTIPTIVGGLYGMNVKLPLANQDWAFLLIMAVTIVLCIIVMIILKKKNLL